MGRPIDSFRVATLEFSLQPLEALALPRHAGSTFRGAFGRVFRRIGCAASVLGGMECVLADRCPYHYIFETPVPSTSKILVKTSTAPRPFVIEPPIDPPPVYEPGTVVTVGLVLVGRAIDYLPYFIFAFDELARLGLGRGTARCRLDSVASVDAEGRRTLTYDGSTRRLASHPQALIAADLVPPAIEVPGSVTLHFLTPTHLQYGGQAAPPREFHVLVRNLLRRVNFLNYFHCGGELLEDPGELIAAARAVETVEARLRLRAWERYSARQDQRVPMGGFVGRVTYRGDLEPLWPWLAAGERVHVGKGATFGLGRYRLQLKGELGLSPA